MGTGCVCESPVGFVHVVQIEKHFYGRIRHVVVKLCLVIKLMQLSYIRFVAEPFEVRHFRLENQRPSTESFRHLLNKWIL